jgi:hypothetical protein
MTTADEQHGIDFARVLRRVPAPAPALPRTRLAGSPVVVPGLQAAGNQALAQLLGGVRPVVQRVTQIKFTSPAHEMDDFDTSTAQIQTVITTRTPTRIAVENKPLGNKQRAHVTSNVVFQRMMERLLVNKTWLQAWTALRDRFQFLHNLATRWYSDATLATGRNATIYNQLPGLIQQQINECAGELVRSGHALSAGVWAAQTKGPPPGAWVYYDHAPTLAGDGVDPATHTIKPWRPLLNSDQIGRLEAKVEWWIEYRGQLPWTSVEAESYVRGDIAGPGQVETAAATHAGKAGLSGPEARQIADAMIKTFDFFPASLTNARTLEHAAGVAARHVVEHFQYHPSIQPAWRDSIRDQFLAAWRVALQAAIAAETRKTQQATAYAASKKRKKSAPKPGRPTAALTALNIQWAAVRTEYLRVYAHLIGALV